MKHLKLHELREGERAQIKKISHPDLELLRRILEMGFLEGAEVELVKKAPFGGDPIAVRVRGCLMGLRNAEAASIEVTRI